MRRHPQLVEYAETPEMPAKLSSHPLKSKNETKSNK
jgi:hypothetical protein